MARQDFEIIFVDNNSETDLSELHTEFPQVYFVTERKSGAAHARNAGLAVARGRKIAFIDADCIADHHWLKNGAQALERHFMVGGQVDVTAKAQNAPTSVEAFEQVFAFQQQKYINRKRFSVTANLFVRRDTANQIGPFSNGVAEDFEWCQRAYTLGIPLVFDATTVVSHPARRTWEDLVRKWDRLTIERWNGYCGSSAVRKMIWVGLAFATAFSSAPHLALVFLSSRISGFKDKLGAARVLIRIRFWRGRRMLSVLSSPQ